MRSSGSTTRNVEIKDRTQDYETKDNMAFFADALRDLGEASGLMAIGFVGQRDIPGFALRTAQSVLRWDRRPSLWSHVFLLAHLASDAARSLTEARVLEVPVYSRTGRFPEPAHNGVTEAPLETYNDRNVDANVALVAFDLKEGESSRVEAAARDYNRDRLRYDLWETLAAWQPYVWSNGQAPNPLTAAFPIPSSAYVEMAYEGIGLDLTPGASERNSAPEHIWNAVVWWHRALSEAQGHGVRGFYALRDPGCSLMDAAAGPAADGGEGASSAPGQPKT